MDLTIEPGHPAIRALFAAMKARARDFGRAAHAAGVRITGTRTSAEVLGMGASHGTIAVGKSADLLVLRADPTADIRNTRQIALVVKRGRVVVR